MRTLTTIILLSMCLFARAQDSDIEIRAQKGLLTLQECSNLYASGSDIDLYPSLYSMFESYGKETEFDAAKFHAVVNALTTLKVREGEFADAREVCDEALMTYNERGVAANCEYTRDLWLFSGQLEARYLKDYATGLNYLHPVQVMCEEAGDYGHIYMVTLMSMALAYDGLDDILSAKIYMDEAIDVFERLNGSIFAIQAEEQFIVLSNYGMILDKAKDYDKAERCFRYVIEHCKDTPVSWDAFQLASNNLASMYIKQGKWEESVALLTGLSSRNDEYNFIYNQNLVCSYLSLKRYPEAISALRNMNSLAVDNVANIFQRFAQSERDSYWTDLSLQLLAINNLAAIEAKTPDAICVAYNNILFCRNLLVDASKVVERGVKESGNIELVNAMEQYKSMRDQLAFKSSSAGKFDSLYWDVTDLEISIIRSIPNLKESLMDVATWESVRQNLAEDEATVEFTQIPIRINNSMENIEAHYGALVITKNSLSPKVVLLGEIDTIEDLFYDTEQDALKISQTYSVENMSGLYSLLWKNIEPLLKGKKTIYYSPTTLLANLNFDMLCDKRGRTLGNMYTLVRVSSTANIGEIKTKSREPYTNAVLFGNVNYDETPSDMMIASEKYKDFTGENVEEELALRSENDRGQWGQIPATKEEVENISSSMRQSNLNISTFEQKEASEEAFKALTGHSPDIIHIATHGFNIDTPEKADGNKFFKTTRLYAKKEDSMMWTGLLMAGANNVWTGKTIPDNVEDGILTAEEISRLDLSNTKLVVLSACETGRGKVDPIDGVIGLQRAFKKAGAGTILMSLWKVQDNATQLLITSFYKYLLNGTEKHAALQRAVNDTKKQYPDPYYWAGFVLLD